MNTSRDGSSRLLPLNGIESIVTIENGSNDELSSSEYMTTSRYNGLSKYLGSCTHQPSVSMINLPSDGKDCMSMLATCIPPSLSSPNQSFGRISLATYSHEKIRGDVFLKRSRRSESYKTVRLVPISDTNALLLAIDALGKLYYCNIASTTPKTRLLDLKHIIVDTDLKHMIFMNTLTTRVEAATEFDTRYNSQSSTQCNPSQTPTKKNRKRKKNSSPIKLDDHGCNTTRRGIYVVASCLNAPLPTGAGPVVMYLSGDVSNSNQYRYTASTTIPIDHTCGMLKCITFVSREKCGDLWGSIASVLMKNDVDADCDAGVLLMGFQDGSLRASIVYKNDSSNGSFDMTLQYTRVATLLSGHDQPPMLSLEVVSAPLSSGSPLLVCCRENSSVAFISSTFIHQQSIQCESRVVSMHITKYEHSPSGVELRFMGVYDNGGSFLHHATFRVDTESIQDWNGKRLDLPLPYGQSVSAPRVHYSNNLHECLFAMPQCNGNVTLFKINSDVYSRHEKEPNDKKSPILAHLTSISNSGEGQILPYSRIAIPKHKLSTYGSLTEKLQSAATNSANQFITNTTNNTHSLEMSRALMEIRDAMRVSSFAMINFGMHNNLAPLSLDGGKVSFKNSPFMKQTMKSWDFSVHVIHMRTLSSMSDPICYRLSHRGRSYTKVLWGGTVHSIAGKKKSTPDSSDEEYFCLPAIQSATRVVASFQMSFSHDSKTWCTAKSIMNSSVDPAHSMASRCSSLVHIASISNDNQVHK